MRNSYWQNVVTASRSLTDGLRLTFGHMMRARKSNTAHAIQDSAYFEGQHGIATIQYPHQTIPVPDNGRYQLHNEIDDCIVCDKCAKVCPVDCITIEPIKSPEEFGKTSDGTPKRIYAAKFDIDMGKCCFCGLCTTVCPTECLTMTKTYDFSVFDMQQHNFPFGNMNSDEIEQKKKALEEHQKAKVAAASDTAKPVSPSAPQSSGIRPAFFKPRVVPPSGSSGSTS
jgi:formate hydrogenlyase subunit 6/NADH:ubiquinone oxidoreductase subunit I